MSKQLVGKFRKSTRYTVEYPTLPSFTVPPENLELRQVVGQHDVLLLSYASNRGDYYEQLKTGLPIKLTWSQGSRTKVWYGYVSVTTQTKAGQTNRPTKVYCIGASFLLKNSSPRVFTNMTIPEVAEELAKEHGFRFVGENHPTRWPQIGLSGGSYWEWLQENAQKIGYVCYVDGTDLVYRPIDNLLQQDSTNLAVMQYWNVPLTSTNASLDRTLDSIEILSGEYLEDRDITRTIKQVGGVDPITGKEFLSRMSPLDAGKALRSDLSGVYFDEHQTQVVANDVSWATSSAEGAAHGARFTLPARIMGQGDPRIRPHGLVYVDGTGAKTDGAWLVRSVTHGMNRGGEYGVDIVAATDGLGSSSVDFKGISARSSEPLTRSIVGKINIEQYLQSATFTSGVGDSVVTVKLPSSNAGLSDAVILKNITNIDDLIANGTTMAKPGFTNTPHRWRSQVPGHSLNSRKGNN